MSQDSTPSPSLDGPDGRAGSLGAVLFDRFRPLRELGRGGWGVVYEAQDETLGQRVALKVIQVSTLAQRSAVHREIVALKVSDFPGVVKLLAHGGDEHALWLALELVEGVPFGAGDWPALEPTVLLLLETLGEVHSRGLVHRDIKPKNVLVRADGRPVLLDFGLATGEAVGVAAEPGRGLVGTPRYLSPEQANGHPASAASDLYALGVMLYESLAGRAPYDLQEVHGPVASVSRRPTPLAALAPSVPVVAAEIIQRMLAWEPSERPSAVEALRALRGLPVLRRRPPRIGGDALIPEILEALDRGESVAIGGEPGSGRSRALEDVAAARPRARWLVPSQRPYGSVLPLTGALPDGEVEAVRDAVRRRLAALEGPLLLDDAARIDPWSRELVRGLRTPNGQLWVEDRPGARSLPPLGEAALRALFWGPSRLFYLPEDAAAELLRQTGGRAGRVADLLQSWRQAGKIHEEDGRFRITRDALAQLSEEPEPPPDAPPCPAELDPELRELLMAVRFCWPHSRPEVVAAVLHRPTWEATLLARVLQAAGLLRAEGDRLVALADPGLRWSEQRRSSARQALARALPVGAPGRLGLLLAQGEPAVIAEEVKVRVARDEAEGRVREAVGLLWKTRDAVASDPALTETLTRLLVEQRSPETHGEAALVAQGASAPLKALVAAWPAAQSAQVEVVEAELARVPRWDRPELESLSRGILLEAWRQLHPDEQERRLLAAERGRPVPSSPARRASWNAALGVLRFRQQRYAEARDLNLAAAAESDRLGRRCQCQLNAARASLLLDQVEEAAALISEVRALAAERRLTALEVDALLLERVVANRRGATCPDLELVEAASTPVTAGLFAQIALIEAVIAWRGRHPDALALARRAQRAAQSLSEPTPTLVACLVWALDRRGDPAPAIARLLRFERPDQSLEGLSLLAWAGARLPLSPAQLDRLEASQLHPLPELPRFALPPAEALALIRRSVG